MKTALLIVLLLAATPAVAADNYTLIWKEEVQSKPRVHMRAGFTKQSCDDAATKLAQLAAFCEATPNEMPQSTGSVEHPTTSSAKQEGEK